MVNAPESDKALRYLQQLDEARCAGRWADVPELCRKVEKHAPHRKCLTLTARSEAQIAAYSTQRPSTTASIAAASNSLSPVIPSLLTAIEHEAGQTQDAFQATVCLGWLHYVLDEPGLAVARLPKDFGAIATQLSSETTTLTAWTRVCLVKGTYLKGIALEKTGAVENAIASYFSILPWLSTIADPAAESVQFRMWSEYALVRLCQVSDQSSSAGQYVETSQALSAYRYWAKFWEATAKSGASASADAARHRRLAWKSYYDTLSHILRHDEPYEPESTPSASEKPPLHDHLSIRLRQRAELKRVETIYENLLIKETHFPKASEANVEVEAWAEAVIGNWRVLCGPTWSDDDLGEGGKEGLGRSVLDILYRAATKTFHSTQILRYLFIVHASLAEFDLAFKAYDSYVEIITRGKDRAEKSGEADVGIDDDSTVLRTSAEAIRLLCRYGSRKEAEKAVEIGHSIGKWLEQSEHIRSASDAGSVASIETIIEPTALATAYYAIGLSQAHWARFTYDVDKRAEFHTRAIQSLRKALAPAYADSNNVGTLFALALVLAESRDIAGAIKAVKRALAHPQNGTAATSTDGVLSGGFITKFDRERKLIPVWHLLALLLTSRSDFSAAEKACQAAFEQFGDPAILFGREDTDNFRSEHLNAVSTQTETNRGIVDRMERFEKYSILQIKMTQLALVEVTDGALAAVDGCDELLALYGRLYGDPTLEKAKPEPQTVTLAPPKSAVGTVRGSIFRGRASHKTASQGTSVRNSSVPIAQTSTEGMQAGPPPAIQVTNDENTRNPDSHHRRHLFHHHHSKKDENTAGVFRTPSKLQKRSSASLRRPSVSEPNQTPEVPPLPENTIANGTTAHGSTARSSSSRRQSLSSNPRKSVESGREPLRPIAHNLPHTSPPLGHTDQPPKQDTRLHARLPRLDYIPPDPHFSKVQERLQKVSLLVSIWIFIAELYTRAEMIEDGRQAISEAMKLVEGFELEIIAESSSARSLAEKGWGGGKSVEELWADAFTARGDLLVAQENKHKARADFERALLHFPDHPKGIVGLSNILLDIYSRVIPLEPAETPTAAGSLAPVSKPITTEDPTNSKTHHFTSHTPSVENQLSPPVLNRLAARDRAFGLLSILTKLGVGWDYSEAWYALARAYEESGQAEKTKEVLWWCVELEDTRPVRSWRNVTIGGLVL
ncbi:hypothetical protein ACN47E_008033 [Coniothyrium glycines]